MFELSVAFKYLIPRWRQLSVSIISLISIMVIALVVWLIVVFFSVTHGLERTWVDKLIALTAPVRITPTEEYYDSYYYLIDSISQDAGYTSKTIGEKLASRTTDAYDPDYDQEIPLNWSAPDLDLNGEVKDLVKLAFNKIKEIKGATGREYEMAITNLKLDLVREKPLVVTSNFDSGHNKSSLSQATYLTSFDATNPTLPRNMYPVTQTDLENLIFSANSSSNPKQMRAKLKEIFSSIQPHLFSPLLNDWRIAPESLPVDCKLHVCAIESDGKIVGVYIPENEETIDELAEQISGLPAILSNKSDELSIIFEDHSKKPITSSIPLYIQGNLKVRGGVNHSSIDLAEIIEDIKFDLLLSIQGANLSLQAGMHEVNIEDFSVLNKEENFWLFNDTLPQSLPSTSEWGDAILLPKSWKESGALIGDRGYLSYQTPTASSIQEQRIPVYVAGFFDPGILSMGGRIILANPQIVSIIRSANPMDDSPHSNGINVRVDDLDEAESIKAQIEKSFVDSGIDRYWDVQTYREFEFTKDFLQQLRSERNLFTLISMVIIIVACSNIVSMLIILVNDKKMEIGILRSMGATSKSIAAIFGFCGIVMGLIGSLLGIGLALITLKNLQILIDFISRVQGFEMFNPTFFGDTLPNEVSIQALGFVLTATALISLIAGIVPAVKASLLRPSAILRSE